MCSLERMWNKYYSTNFIMRKNMKTSKFILTGLFFLLCIGAHAQGYKKAYTLFDASGKEVGFDEMIACLSKPDVVFIGEIHNCVLTHWLEYEISKALYDIHGDSLSMGAEMLEADNQLILDEYLQGMISSDRFEEEARLWPNYATDYSSLVSFAREHHIPFVATNVPRRYARLVKNRGLGVLDSLSDEARSYLPPLPVPFHADTDSAMFGLMRMVAPDRHDSAHLLQAQALKDATMGWSIARHIRRYFLHFNGNYHSDFGKGIIPYLLQYRPQTTYMTVCAVRQKDISRLDSENTGRADFYICVPEDMTCSY